MSERMRLDAALVSRSLVSGREKAKELINGGFVQVNGQTVTKPAYAVFESDKIACDASTLKYVGRGGFKLEKAIAVANITLQGAVAMDVGASTGGFTDCMLQNGASRVYAVDVGYNQLHPRLRDDSRVVNLEKTDIRSAEICKVIPLHSINLCSVDVSFISLRKIIPSIIPFMKKDGVLVCLVKPQFEAGRENIGKNGIVKDARVHKRILQDYVRAFEEWHLFVKKITFSPITGGEGNIEYLLVSDFQPSETATVAQIDALVEEARRRLG